MKGNNVWMNERMNEWMDGWMNEWMKEGRNRSNNIMIWVLQLRWSWYEIVAKRQENWNLKKKTRSPLLYLSHLITIEIKINNEIKSVSQMSSCLLFSLYVITILSAFINFMVALYIYLFSNHKQHLYVD